MERIVNLYIEKFSEGLYLAIGEDEHLYREGWAKNHTGDNVPLGLFMEQGYFEIITGYLSENEDLQKKLLTVI